MILFPRLRLRSPVTFLEGSKPPQNRTNAISSTLFFFNGSSWKRDDYVTKDPRVRAGESWSRPRLLVDFEVGEDGDDSSGGGNSWREELQRRYQQENDFLVELRARNASISQTPSTTLSSSEQEQERGEREEAEGEKEDESDSNWAEAVKRWVNR